MDAFEQRAASTIPLRRGGEPNEIVGAAHTADRDARDDTRLEIRVLEQHGHLWRVDEGRADGVDVDAVLGPLGGPLARE